MSDKKRMDRRSFLVRVVGAAAAGGALSAVTGQAEAQDQTYSGLTDSDSRDPANYGTLTGYSDNDTGSGSDPISRGRRGASPVPCSDNDSGRNGDAARRGRRCGANTENKGPSCSDSDTGRSGDPSGRGRRCNSTTEPPRSACSDSDLGRIRDAIGRGRRCGRT